MTEQATANSGRRPVATVKVGVFVDYMGTTMESPEEQVQGIIRDLNHYTPECTKIPIQFDLATWDVYPKQEIFDKADLLVVDFGGLGMGGAGTINFTSGRIRDWAYNNPNKLVILWTSFSSRFYRDAVQDLAESGLPGETLPNVFLRDNFDIEALCDTLARFYAPVQYLVQLMAKSMAEAGTVDQLTPEEQAAQAALEAKYGPGRVQTPPEHTGSVHVDVSSGPGPLPGLTPGMYPSPEEDQTAEVMADVSYLMDMAPTTQEMEANQDLAAAWRKYAQDWERGKPDFTFPGYKPQKE